MENEYKQAMSKLAFSEEAKKRIAEGVKQQMPGVAQAEGSARSEGAAQATAVRGGASARTHAAPRGRWRVAAVAAAIAVVVMGFGATAYATGVLKNIGDVFGSLLGIAPAQTEVINSIGRPVGASATSNGVTVTVDAILGDRSSLMVVYSIAKDDGSAFDVELSESTGTYPLGFDLPSTFIPGIQSRGGSAGFYDADPDDNVIQYFESVTHNGEDIIGKTAHVSLKNLFEHSSASQEQRMVAEGTWNFTYVINYEDLTMDIPADKTIALNGKETQVSEISLSPIALHVTYEMPGKMVAGLKGESGQTTDEDQRHLNQYLEFPMVITFADGTSLDVSNSSASSKDGDSSTVITRNTIFERIIDLDQVVSLAIGNEVIPLS